MRTIIDILRKGNQELFHSSMIAWLLDPKAEHGMNKLFLEKFSKVLYSKGFRKLSDILSYESLSIKTEAVSHKSRYDIRIKIDDLVFVIENKTKSIGAVPQFTKYDKKTTFPIALGFSDISFSPEVREIYPLITYNDILNILNEITLNNNSDFTVLINHYRLFLERELSLLGQIISCYRDNNLHLHDKINKSIFDINCYTSNDFRFLNLYYLEKLKNYLSNASYLKDTEWKSNKNMSSGTWLAIFKRKPDSFPFSDRIKKLCKEKEAALWFHVEMKDKGLVAKRLDDDAGSIQLKCSCKCENKEMVNEFKKIYELKESENFSSRRCNTWNTFYIVKKNIKKKQLVFSEINELIKNFMLNFFDHD